MAKKIFSESSLPLPLSRITLEAMFQKWREAIHRRENCLVVSLPFMDRMYRVYQFRKRFGHEYNFISLSITGDRIEDVRDWQDFVVKNYSKQQLKPNVFIVSDAEKLLQEAQYLASALSDFYIGEKNLSFLLFSEKYPFTPLTGTLVQNLVFHPLYKKDDIEQFINYLEQKFSIKVTAADRQKIIKQCGGLLWLVKEVVRSLSTNKEENPFDHEALWWRIRSFYQALTDAEQKYLQDLLLKKNPEAEDIESYFTKTGLIENGRITIELLEDFIRQNIKKQFELVVKGTEICLGGVNITHFFSKTETKALTYLTNHQNELITRSDLAKAYWDETFEVYSDWALDQAVKRLRDKLMKLGIPGSYIKTQKGKGYYVTG